MMTHDPMTLAQRLFDTPHFMDPAKALIIAEALGPRMLQLGSSDKMTVIAPGVAHSEIHARPRLQASLLGGELADMVRKRRSYTVVRGVAVIPVIGTLVRRGGWVGAESGSTSYEGIAAQINAAADDPDVRAIALEIDSFGGEAAGMFDLAVQLRAARDKKPVHAFLADYAASAGYGIASQADQITIPPYGMAGSIGVVMLHADYSGNLQKNGIVVTMIHSGEKKVEGNPYEPLPESVEAAWQASGDRMWAEFAQQVEEGRRGRVSATDVLALQAGMFEGQRAVDVGLADQVAEARVALTAFIDDMNPTVVPGAAVGASASAWPLAKGGVVRGVPAKTVSIVIPRPDGSGITGGGVRLTEAGASLKKELTMSKAVVAETEATPSAKTDPVVSKTAESETHASAAQSSRDAVREERERASKISAKAAQAGLPATFSAKLIEEGVPLAYAYERILDEKARVAQDGGDIRNASPTATIVSDGRDRARQGMTEALLAKAGLEGGERNEFSSMSLREMARSSLQSQGIAVPTGSVLTMVGAAFAPAAASSGMHGTSDFTVILADVANKAMLKGFMDAPETYDQFTSVGTMSDFKPTKRVGLDAFSSLAKVEAGAEFSYGTMGDYGATALLATYGKLFSINRQTIVNDDLGAFTRIPALMGRAARRTIGDLVFAVLTGNPNMDDGTALFHADHKNLAGSGAGPSEATINAGITAMSTQTIGKGDAVQQIAVPPKFLLAPPKYRSVVLQSLNSEHAPDDTAKAGTAKMSRAYNTVKDAATPIFDPRLTGDAWFMAADPQVYDVIEVGYLDGETTPFLDQQDGWTVDGTEFKVRIDATATPLAHQGLYKNPGS